MTAPVTSLVLFATLLPPAGVEAQSRILTEAASCRACEIRYAPGTVLGGLSDPASPGPTAEAARLDDGRVAVSSPPIGGEVLLYDPEGRLLRTIGQEGEGPGEFRTAPMIRVTDEGNLAMLDPARGSIQVFAPDGELLSSVPLAMRSFTFTTHAGGYLVSGPRTEGGSLKAIHAFDRTGEVQASFAEAEDGQNMRTLVRRLAVAPDGTIWSAQMSGGLLERWTPDGELLSSWEIQDDDLQREPGTRLDLDRETPPAQVVDLVVDREGRLWIYLFVPDPGFQPGSITGRPVPEDVYDTRVLILDPSAGSVLASEQFPGLLRPLGPGWAFELTETELGDRKVRVGRIRLEMR